MISKPWNELQPIGGVTLGAVFRNGLRVALVVVLAIVAVRFARRAIPRALARLTGVGVRDARWEGRVQTLSHTLVGVVGVVVWTVALITVLDQVGIPLGPLLASAGVAGLAVGFGAQQLVRDVITGFFVLAEDQYGVGDRVTIGAVSGTVESMSLRLTRVRADDGVLHHIRNGDLSVVANASRGYAVATVTVNLPADLDRDEGVERLRAGMAALVESGTVDAELLADPQVLGITEIKDSGTAVVTITARTTPDGRSKVQRAVLRAALAALAAPAAAAPTKPAKPAKPAPAKRAPASRRR